LPEDARSHPTPILPHVLALDDDPDIRAILSAFLPSHELRATTVATGAEMLGLLEQEPIDVVLLDLRLPG
jgi:CheY-like chemotaxis protein